MEIIKLESCKILITGASSGIGRSTAVLASELGASLVLCGRNKEGLEETKSMLQHAERHSVIPFDVTDFGRYEEVFLKAVSDGRKLDGLVHCAGMAKAIPLRMMSPASVWEIMNTNFTSFLELVRFYAKRKYSASGSVVAVSSANAHYPQKCMSAYAASKLAIEAAVKTLALEIQQQAIRINCVVPGAIDTPMMQNTDEESIKKILSKQLLGTGKPEDVANMIVFLLSDASSFITGRAMYVDGGLLGQ